MSTLSAMRHPKATAGAVALSVLAFGLGIADSGRRSLWSDEGVSATIGSGSWHALWHTLRTFDPNMSLYDVALKVWQLGGTGAVWQRSLSAIFLAVTVFVVYLAGRRLGGPGRETLVGLVAAGILAVAPFAVRFAQELRSYALLMLLVATATWLFARLVDSPSTGGAVAFGAVTALAAYAHAYGVLAALALAASLPFLGPALPSRRVLLTAGAAYAATIAPFLLLVATGPDPLIDWITRPSLGSLRGSLVEFAGNNGLLVVVGSLVVLVAVLAGRELRVRGRSLDAWRLALPVLGVVVPVTTAFAYSLVVQPVFVTRYLIVCLPALALAAALGVAAIPWRVAQVAVMAVIVVGSLVSVRTFLREPSRDDWADLVAYVARRAEPGDGVVFCVPSVRPTFEYYALRTPGATAINPLSPAAPWGDGAHVDAAPASAIDAFSRAPRIWVIEQYERGAPSNEVCDVSTSMADRHRADVQQFRGIELRRYDR